MRNGYLFYCRLTLSLLVFLFLLSFSLQTGHGEAFANQVGPKPKIGNRAELLKKNLQRLRQAKKVQRMNSEWLMDIADVVGTATGIGLEGEPEIRVFTAKAGIRGIPGSLDGFPVKAKVTGRFYALGCPDGPTGRCDRPVPMGVSTGHPSMSAGTIGARVTRDLNGDGVPEGVYALSNNHVYAAINDGSIGDSVIQPGSFDGGGLPADFIGTLSAYEEIKFCTVWWIWLICNEANTIDAAIVDVVDPSTGDPLVEPFTLSDGYGSPNSLLHPAFGDPNVINDMDEDLALLLGEAVQKYGRTTGLTYGAVDSINATVDVCYDDLCYQVARFVDQIIITPGSFSGGGDSGSLIVTYDPKKYPVGLLFAGSTTDTVANRIDRVLIAFDVDIDSGPAVPLEDIAIREVSAQTSAVEGDTVNVGVTVENVGNQDVGSNITVTLIDNGGFYDSDMIMGGLMAGASTTLIFNWSSLSPGDHLLVARHEYHDSDPDNDSSSTTVNVEAAFTDIGITHITAPSSVVADDTVDVVVRVENVGNKNVIDPIGVYLVSDNATPGNTEDDTKIGPQTLSDGVSTDGFAELTFPWSSSVLGEYILVASHDYTEYDNNSSNDSASTIVNVELAVTDIAITNITSPSIVSAGSIANVVVRVENLGNQDVTEPIVVQLKSDNASPDDPDDDIPIGTQIIDNGLLRGASSDRTFPWDTTGVAHDIYTLEASHLLPDAVPDNDVGTNTVEVIPPQTATPHLRTGKVCANSDTWTKVNLDHTYQEMVVVCTPSYDRDLLYGTTMPVVAQVRNTHLGGSFEVKLVQAVGGSVERSEAWVYWMVVEAGVYDLPGVKMEADTFVSTVTDNYRSWVGQSRTYQQSYADPVVLGQVMTYNSELWTVFWCRGSSRSSPPSTDYLYVGKHQGEDRWFTRANERVGYIVIEAGRGEIEETLYEARLGADTINGMGDSPPYDYPLNGLSFAPSTAIVTQAGMDGGNGGWAVIYGDDPLAASWIDLAIEEDWVRDSESSHTSEQVGYIVFEEQQFPITIEGETCQYFE